MSTRLKGKTILSTLKARYNDKLRDDIKSVRICQNDEQCYLEVTIVTIYGPANELEDTVINRTDLGWITEDDHIPYFCPGDPLDKNVNKFLTLDDLAIAQFGPGKHFLYDDVLQIISDANNGG